MDPVVKAYRIARRKAGQCGVDRITELNHRTVEDGIIVHVRTGRGGDLLAGTVFVPSADPQSAQFRAPKEN